MSHMENEKGRDRRPNVKGHAVETRRTNTTQQTGLRTPAVARLKLQLKHHQTQ